jgi:AcrR family transcriptional regulator
MTVTAERRPPSKSLSGEKAQRIIEAMRSSVAKRGTAGSTFDRVSREAGVSRGLLHYYFGTKEQLLVEAVRRDCELRLERLQQQLLGAQTAEAFINLAAEHLQQSVRDDPQGVTLIFELFTLSRRNEDIAAEYAALMRSTRDQVASMLAAARLPRGGRGNPLLAHRRLRPAHAHRARPRLRRDRPGGHRLRAGAARGLKKRGAGGPADETGRSRAGNRSVVQNLALRAWHSYNRSANADLRVQTPRRQHLRGDAVFQ